MPADLTPGQIFALRALELFAADVAECQRAYEAAAPGVRKAARDIYGEDGAWRHFASPELLAFDRVARECSA